MTRALPAFVLAALLAGACSGTEEPAVHTLTLIGTNDVHGQLYEQEWRAGLVGISAHVEAVRAVRADDGGQVLLIDAGDMWQGTLESNLNEGGAVVAAYNAMGYDAAAIGNHEFDFGPIGPDAIPRSEEGDRRGALKQRAREANFPLLTANLVFRDTGKAVDWDNVSPHVMLDAGPLKVGVVGVMTSRALHATIAANVDDLEVTPLAAAIELEAQRMRDAGADLVIVTAHAGGRCTEFDDPYDLSSCADDAEIFAVARALPPGLVDHIFAGHVHKGLSHIVNDISISSAYSNTAAFSRVDFEFEATGKVTKRILHPPRTATGQQEYEGRPLVPNPDVVAITERAIELAETQKQRQLGIRLQTAFTLDGNPESALGRLFTKGLLEATDGDIAIHNVDGGLRSNLPAGDLTFGSVYQMSPFENRVVILNLSGAELRRVIAEQSYRDKGRIGFAGLQVAVECNDSRMSVELRRPDGSLISNDDEVRVVTNDYMALGGDGVLTPIMPEGGYPLDSNMPLTRDAFVAWITERGGAISADDFLSGEALWIGTFPVSQECKLAD